MTARWAPLPYEFSTLVSRRMSRTGRDLPGSLRHLGKPPATIEWKEGGGRSLDARALQLAHKAVGEVKCGWGVLVREVFYLGKVINRPITDCDRHGSSPKSSHCGGLAGGWQYTVCGQHLYVDLEPAQCVREHCFQARVEAGGLGARDPRAGAAGTVFNLLHSDHLESPDRSGRGDRRSLRRLLRDFSKPAQ